MSICAYVIYMCINAYVHIEARGQCWVSLYIVFEKGSHHFY